MNSQTRFCWDILAEHTRRSISYGSWLTVLLEEIMNRRFCHAMAMARMNYGILDKRCTLIKQPNFDNHVMAFIDPIRYNL